MKLDPIKCFKIYTKHFDKNHIYKNGITDKNLFFVKLESRTKIEILLKKILKDNP